MKNFYQTLIIVIVFLAVILTANYLGWCNMDYLH